MGFWRKLFGGGSRMPARKAGYEAAASGRRLGNWQPGQEGVNTLLFRDADLMRSRARDLVRRNAWAFNAVDALVSNLVGTGIKPRSTHQDVLFKERVHALWQDWTREADAHGLYGFYGLQALAVRAMVEGGKVLARLRNREARDGLTVPLQIQLLEPEHLPFTLNRDLPNGHVIRAGIEFDRIGRRVAYHIYREHPGERAMAGGGVLGERHLGGHQGGDGHLCLLCRWGGTFFCQQFAPSTLVCLPAPALGGSTTQTHGTFSVSGGYGQYSQEGWLSGFGQAQD